MARAGSSAAELERCRQRLIVRAQLERRALQDTTEELQVASERIVRIAMNGIALVRRYWLPVGVVLAGGLFMRPQRLLRFARTGIVLWQTVQLLRSVRR